MTIAYLGDIVSAQNLTKCPWRTGEIASSQALQLNFAELGFAAPETQVSQNQ